LLVFLLAAQSRYSLSFSCGAQPFRNTASV
jgi:hypothetical protein